MEYREGGIGRYCGWALFENQILGLVLHTEFQMDIARNLPALQLISVHQGFKCMFRLVMIIICLLISLIFFCNFSEQNLLHSRSSIS